VPVGGREQQYQTLSRMAKCSNRPLLCVPTTARTSPDQCPAMSLLVMIRVERWSRLPSGERGRMQKAVRFSRPPQPYQLPVLPDGRTNLGLSTA